MAGLSQTGECQECGVSLASHGDLCGPCGSKKKRDQLRSGGTPFAPSLLSGEWECDRCGPTFAVLEGVCGPPREGRPPELAQMQGTPIVRCLQCGWSNFCMEWWP